MSARASLDSEDGDWRLKEHKMFKRTPNKSMRPAFTLVELLVVLTIIGIMTAIAVPRFSQVSANQHIENAARRIAADIALCQRQAKLTSARSKIEFSPVDDAYTVLGVSNLDHAGQRYRVELSSEPYAARIVSADFGGTVELTFDGFGQPVDGGAVIVNVGKRYVMVTVDAETGGHTTRNLATFEIELLGPPVVGP